MALVVKWPACQCRRYERYRFDPDPWVWTIPWGRALQSSAVFLPAESHAWWAPGPRVAESDTAEVTYRDCRCTGGVRVLLTVGFLDLLDGGWLVCAAWLSLQPSPSFFLLLRLYSLSVGTCRLGREHGPAAFSLSPSRCVTCPPGWIPLTEQMIPRLVTGDVFRRTLVCSCGVLKTGIYWAFPWGPVVRTPHSCCGPEFTPWLGY